jgi:hypothetical protein
VSEDIPWNKIKPRDELAQEQIDFRDQASGVDLTQLPVMPVADLTVGSKVFHEGFWCEITEHEVQEHGIRVRIAQVQPEGQDEQITRTAARELIMQPGDYLYVPPDRLLRSEERRRRLQNNRTPVVPRAFRRPSGPRPS